MSVPPETHPQKKFTGFTLRSLLLGCVAVVVVGVGDPFSYNILKASLLAHDSLPLGVIFPFILLVAVVNVALKAIRREWALRPPELLVVIVMGWIASTLVSNTTGYILGNIAAPSYFASPENQWAQFFHRHIPQWMVPGGDGNAAKWFFEGLPAGESIPWRPWIIPLFWWLSLICVIFFVCFCMVAILRKQWVEKERLIFPLAEIPVEMVRESDSSALLPAFMRGKVFWIGFAIPCAILVWNMFGYFNPLFPTIPMKSSFIVARSFPAITTNIYFPLIAFAFLINLDVSLSIWFFFLLGVIQTGISTRLGFAMGTADVYCSGNVPMAWQGFGAFIVMVLWGLWMARSHLKDVFRKAFDKKHPVDDSGELVSYRTAVFGLIFGVIYITGWLYKSGMQDIRVLTLFLFGVFIMFLGLTRIVIEGGVVFLRAPMISQVFTVYAVGSTSIAVPSMTALAFSYMWSADMKCIFMAAAANTAKLRDAIGGNRKQISLAVAIAVIVGFAVSIGYTLHIGYEHGAYNFGRHIFRGGATFPFDAMVAKMKNPFEVFQGGLLFLGIGGVVMALLTFLRYRFLWWPLHPLGFTIASTLPIRWTAFSVFIAWAAKWLIIRFGGVSLYRSSRPFFFGLIVGSFVGVGISFAVDMIWFPGQGHNVYGW
ncbi:MAG: hypothetical protein KAI38_03725 [Candidatus Latescibacteria bacterium]|nr:hypothetical protein [Candidatus Latescibacterota bacterium]